LVSGFGVLVGCCYMGWQRTTGLLYVAEEKFEGVQLVSDDEGSVVECAKFGE